MSKLQTTTSTTRPASPPNGTMLFETDTNRILFWDGTQYHVYNRDSLINTTGGVEELHYPGGLYADSTATYYIGTTPMLHFDASHMNGVDKTQVYGHGAHPQFWYDRTSNKYKFAETTSGVDSVMDLNKSGTLSSNTNTMPCVQTNGSSYVGDPPAPVEIGGDVTTFFVLQPNNTDRYTFPAGPTTGTSGWYTNNAGDPGTYYHMGINFSANMGGTPNSAWTNTGETSWNGWRKTVDSTTGPGLYIARNSTSGNQVWRPDTRGNHVPITVGKTTSNISIAKILPGGASNQIDQYAWEIMFFNSALSIAEVNKVKSYLQNKYEGLNADFFPTGGTVDLTD